jgi:hypothetical protein
MAEPLDERYLEWLYGQVASVRLKNPARTYWSLMKLLYTTEFVWLIPNDDNRVEDGRDLRQEFINDAGLDQPESDWMTIECSFLEMLISLSRRLAFHADDDGDAGRWFWHLLNNINLGNFNDVHFKTDQQKEYVESILEKVIWRLYRDDGFGGLFPLRNPKEDQRKVELWYQLSSYLLEGHLA